MMGISLFAAIISFFISGCTMGETRIIKLPPPDLKGRMSVEEAIAHRRSRRRFSKRALTLNELSQLLWSCQGITDSISGFRAAPSAGATYPFETYIVVGNVKSIEAGLYRYIVKTHSIELLRSGDIRKNLRDSCLGQEFIAQAPATIILSADYPRTTLRYGERGYRYVAMEAGHIGENLHLQCEALGLGTCMVGAVHDDKVKALLEIKEEPLYIMPIGEPK